jgi:3',5'-cyclic AMP phosphodiesterase CpdA
MTPVIDPRSGDIEDDASSTKNRSLLAITGSMLAEISLPRLLFVSTGLIILPGFLLGLAPLVVSAWLQVMSQAVRSSVLDIWPILIFLAALIVGLFGGVRLFRLAEQSFWSLNAIVIQPVYVILREAMRQLLEGVLVPRARGAARERVRAIAAAAAGIVLSLLAMLAVLAAWPLARFVVAPIDLSSPAHVIVAAIANGVVLAGAYLAAASLVWGFIDARTGQPHDMRHFERGPPTGRSWRVAHLSDLHIVGETYGFRIESGRAGPQGNHRLKRTLARLSEAHADDPIDLVLVTGDMTDAGRSTEWAEFHEALRPYPWIAERILMVPGNHDVNIVDRANPARLDLPGSPNKRLRKFRTLFSMYRLMGERVHVMDQARKRLGPTLRHALDPQLSWMAHYADHGRPRLNAKQKELWARVFPMILPPAGDDGLGVMLINSNADTHFSFTNALGMISAEQLISIRAIAAAYPDACWIIALHHHLVEYPRKAKSLSERVGTVLINGNWMIRQLQPLTGRAVLMHGHRHIDWIGECMGLKVVSAPSPVMEATDDMATSFYIHTLERTADGNVALGQPEEIRIDGVALPHDSPASG